MRDSVTTSTAFPLHPCIVTFIVAYGWRFEPTQLWRKDCEIVNKIVIFLWRNAINKTSLSAIPFFINSKFHVHSLTMSRSFIDPTVGSTKLMLTRKKRGPCKSKNPLYDHHDACRMIRPSRPLQLPPPALFLSAVIASAPSFVALMRSLVARAI